MPTMARAVQWRLYAPPWPQRHPAHREAGGRKESSFEAIFKPAKVEL